jgi:hypothetical protein
MTNHDLQLRAGVNSTKVTIKADGKVGVGTNTPAEQLHVIGGRARLESNGKYIDLRTDGSQVDLQSETNKLYLRSSGPSGNNQIIMNHDVSTDGEVGIGTENPQGKLHVAKSVAGDASNLNAHVAVIENTSFDPNADVLALSVGTAFPTGSNNYVTFFGGGIALASIEGDGWGDVMYRSSGADYAESLPCLDEAEIFEGGDVVGIVDGKVTRRTSAVQHVSVITDRPVVVANSPRPGERKKSQDVAFVGQVMVRVSGPVRAGEYIIPSGNDDGVGLALPAEKLSLEQVGQIVGQAWETVPAGGVKRVLTAIGLPMTSGAILRVLGDQIKTLQQQMISLKQ